MFINPPDVWFCCIHPADRSVLRNVGAVMLLTLGLGMPIELWDAAWFASLRDGDAYRAAFRQLYHLEIGTIVDGGVDIPAVVPTDGYSAWWLLMGAWLLLPQAACLEGCQQSSRPVM